MAVYTEVSEQELSAFLGAYELGRPAGLAAIAEGVENSNFRLHTTAGVFILTLYEKRVDVAELPWFLGLMQHLANRGIDCPRPVAGRDGQALRLLCGRAAAITTFLPGAWPRDVGLVHCRPVGTALAALHRAGEGFAPTRANALGPPGWAPLLARTAAGAEAAGMAPDMVAELAAVLPRIVGGWPRGLPSGHIHADLFPDNVFFQDGRLSGLIDFYFAATDLYAYDVAVCLNAWCFSECLDFVPERASALLAGYESLRPLAVAERAALPLLCAGAALRFALTRLHDWIATPPGALVTRKDPADFVARLRLFLAQGEGILAGL